MSRYIEVQSGGITNSIEWDGVTPFNPPNTEVLSTTGKAGSGLATPMLIGNQSHLGQEPATTVFANFQTTNGNFYRTEIHWAFVEAQRGVLAFPGNDATLQNIQLLLTDLQNASVQYVTLLSYGNTLYGDGSGGFVLSADEIGGYANYAAYMVSQLPQCSLFEIWNEWNGGLGGTAQQIAQGLNTPQAFLTLLQTAYPAMKIARAGAQVVAGGFADPSVPGSTAGTWLTQFLALPNWWHYCDAISFHMYDRGLAPEDWYFQTLQWVTYIRAVAGANFPIYITETGWPTGTDPGNLSTAVQAQYASRWVFLLRALPINGVTFYELHDGGTDGATQDSYGIFNYTWFPKTAVNAIAAATAHVLAATGAHYYPYQGSYNPASCAGVLLETATGLRLALWHTAARTFNLTVNAASNGTLSIQTMGGSTTTQPLVTGANTIAVSLNTTAVVVSANVSVTYPQFPLS